MSKDKIRILFVLSEFMYGSKVRQLCDLVNGLDKNIYDIEVCALELGNEATGEIAALGVPFYQLRLYPPRSLDIAKIIQFLKSPAGLRRNNYDLVHSLLYQSIFIEPMIIKLFSHAKYIYTKTNLEWNNHRFNWNLKSRLADRIISISRATDDLLESKGFGGKARRIYLGLNTEKFVDVGDKSSFRNKYKIDRSVFVFGCAAQFVEWKMHGVLLDAFEQLCEKYSNIALLLCGPDHGDSYFNEITSRIDNSRYKHRVFLLGTLDDMPAFYSALDCFVLPSNNETFGYVYIEAMSCGLPVIGCNRGGPLDIIDEGRNGYLVDVLDVDGLRDRMELYSSNPELAREHGKSARKKVIGTFSRDAMVKRHQELYMDIYNDEV